MLRRLRTYAQISGLLLAVFVLISCSGTMTDPDEEGGVIGTGIKLNGTVTSNREYANNTIQIRSVDGDLSSALFNELGRFEVDEVPGSAPYLLRTDFGNSDYQYGIAFDVSVANVNSYSDVILRNWFGASGQDIGSIFESGQSDLQLPDSLEYRENAKHILALAELALEKYDVVGTDVLYSEFDSANDNLGIDTYLRNNPVFIQDDVIAFIFTDPVTNTQSKTRSTFSVFDLVSSEDAEAPDTPASVRALSSAIDEVILVWEPSSDNRGVVGYQIFRDTELIATTPYPVYIDSGLTENGIYTYEVIAFDSSENYSAPSQAVMNDQLDGVDETPPPAPQQLMANPSLGRIDLLWGQNEIADVVSFKVYRGQSDSNLSFLTGVSGSLMSDVSVSAGVRFCYRVSAVDAAGNESELSEETCAIAVGDRVSREVSESLIRTPENAGLVIPDVTTLDCSNEWEFYLVETPVTVGAGCFLVKDDVVVNNGGSLKLEPGVYLLFDSGTGVTVNSGGSFETAGTKTEPVVLSASDPVPGYWDGVVYNNSLSSRNSILNTVIEYAGGGGHSSAVALIAGHSDRVNARIESSLIRTSYGFGILASSKSSSLDGLSDTVITSTEIPLKINVHNLSGISQKNRLVGNIQDVIDTGKSTLVEKIVLTDLGIPYLSEGVSAGPYSVSLFAGVEILFSKDAHMSVSGSFSADGTVENPIKLSGLIEVPGYWRGLTSDGILDFENVVVEYGGEQNLALIGDFASLSNVTLQHAAKYGLVLGNDIDLTKAKDIRLHNNHVSLRVPSNKLHLITNSFELQAEGLSVVEVHNRVLTNYAAVLGLSGVHYQFVDGIDLRNSSMHIGAGVDVEIGVNKNIQIYDGSSLVVNGTIESPVTITSDSRQVGKWQGIYVSNHGSLFLDYAVVERVGSVVEWFNSGIYFQCDQASTGQLRIADSVLQGIDGWAISIERPSCPFKLERNSFYNNTEGDFRVLEN